MMLPALLPIYTTGPSWITFGYLNPVLTDIFSTILWGFNDLLAFNILSDFSALSPLSLSLSLYNRSIIYRDLKSDNIGFDVRGDAKLFDFGLATEFDVAKHGNYKLTGDTGTIRYMAPEVCNSQPYTEKADVYSFGILLWQILALADPYPNMSSGVIEYKVCHLGLRPKIDPTWSNAIRRLLQDCFAGQPRRPTMDVVCSVLRREVNSLSDKKLVDDGILDSSRSAISARLSARYYEEK